MPDTPQRSEGFSVEDYSEVADLFREYARTRNRTLRNDLVERHRWIGTVAARRFSNRGEPYDDLLQVAMFGVLKAVERFDPDYGSSFATFAMPTVVGELRRYFRDATWTLRVTRRAKDIHLALGGVIEDLTHELGRSPRIDEIARAMRTTEDEVLDAMEAGKAYRATSLSQRLSEDSTAPEDSGALAFDDERLGGAAGRVALSRLLQDLPEREREIVYLRFYRDMTQSEIAEQIGVSQVHVSRLLRSSLEQLRRRLGDEAR